MNFSEYLQRNAVYLDGGLGTLLQSRGLKAGEQPERWNLTRPQEIIAVHVEYFNAGSNVVSTNTFGANLLKFEKGELERVIAAAVENAKLARAKSTGTQEKFIALDIGPLGKLLRPYGDLDFEKAVEIFAETVKIGANCGVDLVLCETFTDSYETKAAVLAVKENCSLPVIVCNAYGEDGKLMTGATPAAMVAMLEGLGVNALGANCSLGPKQLIGVVDELLQNASVPIVLKPNAGLPSLKNGAAEYDVSDCEFAEQMRLAMEKGVRVVGGCCGTTPRYIEALTRETKALSVAEITDKNLTVVSSYTHAVPFLEKAILIGERINPTGKKRFKQALVERDISYLLGEGVSQQERGAQILDVNVGIPEIDEKEMLETAVCELQAVVDLPLQIDTADPVAMERALRRYNGKAMVNSVNGKKESMETVFPLVKKYGGLVVALTLDEDGIPQKAEGRVRIARKILEKAAEYGVSKKDIIFDPLAMTVSADENAAKETLRAIRLIETELGAKTSLGVSNVSFGLPNREFVNAAFFTLALENGLSAAIMNPYSSEMMKAYYTYNLLKGLDKNCAEYVAVSSQFCSVQAQPTTGVAASQADGKSPLYSAIVKGFKDVAATETKTLLGSVEPLEIVNGEIIPALNSVGEGFEKKTVFLPQLLMSAEAAKSAFEQIKAALSTRGTKSEKKGPIVLATVEGDIHDIGKNIVKLLLENYGFDVMDLGKDVPVEKVVQETVKTHAPIVGLSALMTTTVPAMQRTIERIRESAPWSKIVVGGAVLTKDYAEKIGADAYAKDAMESVRYAESVLENSR